MTTDTRTTNRNYKLPFSSNLLAADVVRLREALQAIDVDVDALFDSLATKLSQAQTEALIGNALSALVDGAPGALDTLNELAAALGDDANFATTVTNALAEKAPQSRTVAAGTGLAGGGDLSASRTISADVASQAEAEAGTSSTKLMTPQRTAQAISVLATGGAVLYNRRPALHRGSLFYKTAATTISIVAGAVLNGHLYAAATAVTMPGSFTNNTDYAIWQNPTTAALVANASFTTAPAGATGGSIVGGFHYIPSGRPTAVNNGSPTGAAEILEFSLWDLTWRPSSPDPRGMACIEGGFWMDLYLCGATSYAGSTFSAVPSSRIGLTIADGSSPPLVPAQYGGNGSTAYANGKWFTFAEVAASFGKRLPRWQEFSAAAFGAPEASSRGTDPGTVIWERVSKFGLAQATGVMWQWGQETCTAESPSAFTMGTETDSRGQVYGPPTRAVLLGGLWSDATSSGSRCAAWSATPWVSNNSFGARFAAGHLVLG